MNIFLIFAILLKCFYGYEAINILFRIAPSKFIISILRYYGAKIGKNVRIQAPFLIHNADIGKPIYKNLVIGDNCYVGRDAIFDLADKIKLKNRVTLSHRILINTHTNDGSRISKTNILNNSFGPVKICSDTYVGSNVTILESVVIGHSTIIGANSLVNKSLPENSKAYGIPAKLIKSQDAL